MDFSGERPGFQFRDCPTELSGSSASPRPHLASWVLELWLLPQKSWNLNFP